MDRYTFEVEPWIYAGARVGTERVLRMRVLVNGEEVASQRIMPGQQPFETEIEYYTRIAVADLHARLSAPKEEPEAVVDTANNPTPEETPSE